MTVAPAQRASWAAIDATAPSTPCTSTVRPVTGPYAYLTRPGIGRGHLADLEHLGGRAPPLVPDRTHQPCPSRSGGRGFRLRASSPLAAGTIHEAPDSSFATQVESRAAQALWCARA